MDMPLMPLIRSINLSGVGPKSSSCKEHQPCSSCLYFRWLHEANAIVHYCMAWYDQQGIVSRYCICEAFKQFFIFQVEIYFIHTYYNDGFIVLSCAFADEIACVDPDICTAVCENPVGCSNVAYPKLVQELLPPGI